jgi:ferric-dicitrate binding protein FerR (iron transport regulator)
MMDLEELLSDESFQRFLEGKARGEERLQWESWLKDPANRQLYERAKTMWQELHFRPAAVPDVEKEWQRLKSRLRLRQDSAKILTLPQQRTFSHQKRRSFFWVGMMAAAMLLFFSYFLIRYEVGRKSAIPVRMQEIVTEFGQRATVHLPDGTVVILNANSKLRYPASWTEDTPRRVSLLYGEAYFDVVRISNSFSSEFQVVTEDGTVTVKGTKFSVYCRSTFTRVALEEGLIEVTRKEVGGTRQKPARVLVRPGQYLKFSRKSNRLVPVSAPIQLYLTWWKEEIVLDKTPFREIVQRIEETYGVDVVVTDPKLLTRTLSGSLSNRNLALLTSALAKALNVSVRQDGDLIIFGK